MSGWHFDLVRQGFVAENVKFGYNPNHKDYKLCVYVKVTTEKSVDTTLEWTGIRILTAGAGRG